MKLKQDLIEKLRNGEIAVERKDNKLFFKVLDSVTTFMPSNNYESKFAVIELRGDGVRYVYKKSELKVPVFSDKDFFEEDYSVKTDGLEEYIGWMKDSWMFEDNKEFKNGDEVEYMHEKYSWETAIYVGKHPKDRLYHIVIGLDYEPHLVGTIRHKQKEETKEQIIERIKEQLTLAKAECSVLENEELCYDYIQQALIDIEKL